MEQEKTTSETTAEQPAEKQENKPTFDDILKDKEYQSVFDKRIAKALETAKESWQRETDEKIIEAKKLEQMSAEQKAAHERERAEKKLVEREAAVTRREITAEIKSRLAGDGLPTQLAEVINCTDAKSADESYSKVCAAFNEAVEKAVNDKLRGTPPKKGADNSPKDSFLEGLGM